MQFFLMTPMHRAYRSNISSVTLGLCAALLFAVVACAPQAMPFHGFASQSALNQAEAYVMKESIGGKMDPQNLAEPGQKYLHDGIYYNQIEEGYYEWGSKMYQMGYRDEYYVRDLAPKAFGHELLDTYDHAIAAGFDDTRSAAGK